MLEWIMHGPMLSLYTSKMHIRTIQTPLISKSYVASFKQFFLLLYINGSITSVAFIVRHWAGILCDAVYTYEMGTLERNKISFERKGNKDRII